MSKTQEQIELQKQKLEDKKAKLLIEEANFKIKERKMHLRHLIEIGGLVIKAGIDNLPTNTLYGALLALKEQLDTDETILATWYKSGETALAKEEEQKSLAVIVKFTTTPATSIRNHIRKHGLKWNKLRSEWGGYATDLDALKAGLLEIEHSIELLEC